LKEVKIIVENQIDEVATVDAGSGNSDNSAIREDHLGRRSKRNVLRRAMRRLRSSGTVKFMLFREEFPKHRVIEKITPWHAILVFYVSLFVGLLGFMVLAYATFVGFMAYYAAVAVGALEVMHYLCDR